MSLKNRVEKLENKAGTIESDDRIELVIPWPGDEPIRVMLKPRVYESVTRDLERAYGPEA